MKTSLKICIFVLIETIKPIFVMQSTNFNKEAITKAVVKEIKKQYTKAQIQATYTSEFQNPSKLAWKNKGENYMPDIIVQNVKEGLNIYEIELSGEFDIDKWKLYSLYAKKSNGRFFLVLPRWLMGKARQTLNDNELRNVSLESISE